MAFINSWDAPNSSFTGGTGANPVGNTTPNNPWAVGDAASSPSNTAAGVAANWTPPATASNAFATPSQLTALGAGLPVGAGSGTGTGWTPPAASTPAPTSNTTGSFGPGYVPGTPPVAPPNPWQSITGSINGANTNLAPGLTQGAGANLANMFGANLVGQNLNNMASPGSSAPSSPRMGLDFGYGDVQDAEQVQRWRDRGDSDDLIRQRLQAGRDNTGWGGPAPQVNRGDSAGLWNMSAPLVNNHPQVTPQASFGADQYKANLGGAGQPSLQALMQAGQYNLGQPPTNPQNGNMNAVLAFLGQFLGQGGLSSLMAQLGLGGQDNGTTTRQPNLTNARNTAFQHDQFYPRTEPTLY